MAGDWIKWTKGLARKREVLAMSARMEQSPANVAGLCMILWEWLDDNVTGTQIDENGNAHVTLGALQPSFIDSLVGANGFAAAMSAEGWLCLRSGSLTVPNYGRHNGQTAKDRALTSDRVQRHRKGKCNGESVTHVTVGALPEKRREEYKSTPPSPREAITPSGPGSQPAEWMSVETRVAWQLWQDHLYAKDVHPTPQAWNIWKSQLQKVCPAPATQGPAIAVIQFSISKQAKSLCFGGEINQRSTQDAHRPQPQPSRQSQSNAGRNLQSR
jgi:hypothetical protein